MRSPLNRLQGVRFRRARMKVESEGATANNCDRSEQTRMGASCTTLDVSPAAAKMIHSGSNYNFIIQDAQYETVWACLGLYINSAVERHKVRRLLRRYLEDNPCRDRYLGLTLGDRRWVFEIVTNRCEGKCTEILLTARPVQNS